MPEVNTIYTGDCLSVMATWPESFVDTIITDPPYGLEFMGKDWDGDVPGVHFWTEMLRVAKPGAILLSFGGTRTWHHLAVAIEKAGWVIRDTIVWLYGSGFPKSLDISKAIDKAAGHWRGKAGEVSSGNGSMTGANYERTEKGEPITAIAMAWDGYGTALKPAWEPILLAMKPLDGTFAENAEKWGVAGLNVDGGRIGTNGERPTGSGRPSLCDPKAINPGRSGGNGGNETSPLGRWPANLILDEEAAEMLDGVSGGSKSTGGGMKDFSKSSLFQGQTAKNKTDSCGLGDFGGASRFFYVAKSARAERNEGCDGMPDTQTTDGCLRSNPDSARKYQANSALRKNHHPTVKPLELMKYLCMLTKTPTGGVVLDPFCGSGTTLWAAEFHNRPWIGIEMNPEYVAIAQARIARERAQMKMAI
jgi:site-specific DNA-methyltransferase (adenine-specific)